MANTKRARRYARGTNHIELGSSRWQLLMWGELTVGADGPAFESEIEEREAWHKHRDELMAECQPGERPAAYFTFDLRLQELPGCWFDHIGILDSRGLVTDDEGHRVEKDFEILSGSQDKSLCASFDHPETSRDASENLGRQFDVAAEWHRRRGRKDLAEKYSRRAAVVRSVLSAAAA